jgi:hypothetical protein
VVGRRQESNFHLYLAEVESWLLGGNGVREAEVAKIVGANLFF